MNDGWMVVRTLSVEHTVRKGHYKLDIALKPCWLLASTQLITVETSIPIKLVLIKLSPIARLLSTPDLERINLLYQLKHDIQVRK